MAADRLVMQIYDYDKVKDEIVGSMRFHLKDFIEKGRSGDFFWKNIYGAPLDKHGSHTDRMNANPEYASLWKGRILMQVVSEITDKPLLQRIRADGEAQKQAQAYMQQKEYLILAEVSQGVCLPSDSKYKVRIRIADCEMTTDKPNYRNNGYCFWNHRFKETVYKAPYKNVAKIGKVFVYLMDGDDAICYFKGDAKDFTNPNAQLQWVPLVNDRSVGDVSKAYRAGMLSFKLTIHDLSTGPLDVKSLPEWNSRLPDRPASFKARCYIFQCKELPAADSNGTSDPYIEVWSPHGEAEERRTKVVEDNINPIFYGCVEVMFYALDLKTAPPMVLEIYDHDDSAFDANDYIGRSCIDVSDPPLTLVAQGRAHLARRHCPDPQLAPCEVQLREGRADDGSDFGVFLDRAARLQVQADPAAAPNQVAS